MKRSLLVIIMICSIFQLKADIKYNEKYGGRIYSVPDFSYDSLENYNKQIEYEKLFIQVISLLHTNLINNVEVSVVRKQIASFLNSMNSDVGKRLYSDLFKNGFYPYMITVFILNIYPPEQIKKLAGEIPEKSQALILQIGGMITRFWNNGVYGKFAHEQICFYLENLNTPEAQKLLQSITREDTSHLIK